MKNELLQQKGLNMNLSNPQTISQLHNELNKASKEFPLMFEFLEYFCGLYTPILSDDPMTIVYSAGKRDVILTIKTLMRTDVPINQITSIFKKYE
ncbi:MAG: hypothetical protein MJ250_08565 [Alphaproteobacteria bacterium]|nr:hypothetical protein [Alphaproteobacteria bacterium]